MSTCTHTWAASYALPFDGGCGGPAAGGYMRRIWCTQCTTAAKIYGSAGYTSIEPGEHPRKTAERQQAARAAELAALPLISAGAGHTVRVVDIAGLDCTGVISLRTVTVESSWAGRQVLRVEDLEDSARKCPPAVAAVYAGLLAQAQQIAQKSWAR